MSVYTQYLVHFQNKAYDNVGYMYVYIKFKKQNMNHKHSSVQGSKQIHKTE